MFFKRGLLALLVGGFFLTVLMGGATRAAYYAGMQRGYATAVSQIPAPSAEAGPQAAVPPAAPYGPPMMGYGYDRGYGMYHGHSFIGGFFRVLFFFLLFGWLFRLLRWRRRGHWGGWGGHHGRHHWHGHHGSPDGRSAKEKEYDAHGPIMHA